MNNKTNGNSNQKPKPQNDSPIITKPAPTCDTFTNHSKERKESN